MNKRTLFLILVVAQLAVPSWMIASQENILTNGTLYKFKTAPVDPYDIFRGRYVALSTDQRSVTVENAENVERGQDIYLIIGSDPFGFGYARVQSGQFTKPKIDNYIKTKVTYKRGNLVHFRLPIERYYMNEKKAPKAEALYRRRGTRGNRRDAYIAVRVLNGSALIEELYIDGQPIGSYFKGDGKQPK